jgi:uncharacterized protein YjbJ (UPF0337 family)
MVPVLTDAYSIGTELDRTRFHDIARRRFPKRRLEPNFVHGEITMDWNRIEGNWKQFRGKAKEQWGKLTDDEIDQVEGRREQLEGKIQERYGYAKDQTRKEVDEWLKRM